MNSMFGIFECTMCPSSVSSEEIKPISTADWIFRVLDFLRLFMSFKYGLILLGYFFYIFHFSFSQKRLLTSLIT